MTETVLACHDCGQLHRIATARQGSYLLSCARCGGPLSRAPAHGFDRPLAYALAAFVLFLLANMYPIFVTDLEGDQRYDRLITGAVELVRYGGGLAGLGVMVGVLSILVPGIRLILIITVLAGLRPRRGGPRLIGYGPPRPRLAAAWKAALALAPWSMLDVYLLGAFVAYTRLHGVVTTTVGIGGYALGALVMTQAMLQLSLGRRQVWNAIADPQPYAPAPGQSWIMCPDCRLVLAAAPDAAGPATRRCPRCAARLEPREPRSLTVAAALTAAAYILYLPANLLPVMRILHFGSSQTNTILSGVRELAALGMWPLALLVLFASIVVPVLKLVSLSWFLISIRRGSARLLRQRTKLYRLIDFVGRWSYIDVFMISILVALLRFGALTTVEPGTGAVSFGAVVALTMLATRVFDPRLMWDAARERGAR